jgi:hypothetical protein
LLTTTQNIPTSHSNAIQPLFRGVFGRIHIYAKEADILFCFSCLEVWTPFANHPKNGTPTTKRGATAPQFRIYNMTYVWVSSYSKWDKETSRFQDQFKEYFTSRKKAVEAATYACKVMDQQQPEINHNESYTSVHSFGKLSRHYYINREIMQ